MAGLTDAMIGSIYCLESSMSRSNPLLWPKPPLIWSYGIAVLLVTGALIISRSQALHLESAPVSLFLLDRRAPA